MPVFALSFVLVSKTYDKPIVTICLADIIEDDSYSEGLEDSCCGEENAIISLSGVSGSRITFNSLKIRSSSCPGDIAQW